MLKFIVQKAQYISLFTSIGSLNFYEFNKLAYAFYRLKSDELQNSVKASVSFYNISNSSCMLSKYYDCK